MDTGFALKPLPRFQGFHGVSEGFQHPAWIDRKNRLVLRFHYNWTADEIPEARPFSGVGDRGVDELLNGFDK